MQPGHVAKKVKKERSKKERRETHKSHKYVVLPPPKLSCGVGFWM